ncbi:MAG TPA: homoserine kinase [Hyphomonadaceae bacterium]|jgi:homoserine kinase type II|nr:homoserine kinase [Hyphomonadaceae bacterium]
MAVYTDIDDAALEALLSEYDLGPPLAFKGIAEGVQNSNFLLETPKGRYILTVFEPRVKAEDLPFFMGMMSHLAEKGFPAALPVPARDGKPIRTVQGKPAVIATFLQGMSPRRPDIDQCRQLGAGLARFHRALDDFRMRRPNDLSLASWPKMWEGREAGAEALNAGLAAQIDFDLDVLKANWPKTLPGGAIHADLFPDNTFFLDGKLSGVIDFYFACTDFLAYDLAVCLNAWAFERRGEYNLTKGRALMSGYESVRKLEPRERAAIPILARGAAMRFFLTRLVDLAATPKDALVKPHNPMDYAERLGFHRQARGPEDYGA